VEFLEVVVRNDWRQELLKSIEVKTGAQSERSPVQLLVASPARFRNSTAGVGLGFYATARKLPAIAPRLRLLTTSLIAFTLPSTPYSVQMARFYTRAALTYHDLGGGGAVDFDSLNTVELRHEVLRERLNATGQRAAPLGKYELVRDGYQAADWVADERRHLLTTGMGEYTRSRGREIVAKPKICRNQSRRSSV
jgi:hypothetical protein